MPAYITRKLLEARLLAGNVNPPELQADFDRLIAVASGMVADRAKPTTPTEKLEQCTLMLAMRMRINEIGGYLNADGTRSEAPLWTKDLTDILGEDVVSETPQTVQGQLPAAGVMTATVPVAAPAGWPNAYDPAYGGWPYPRQPRRGY